MTPENRHLLFLQHRASRAGAQTSLERMVLSEAIRELNPAVLIAQSGWLSEALERHEAPALVSPWPSPRSLRARLGGLKKFSREAASALREMGIVPEVIVANDHQECLLAQSLSREMGNAPVIAILRTPGMDQRDFEKYRCGDCEVIFGEGHELRERLEEWAQRRIPIFEEGFAENEFRSPKDVPDEFPAKIFVAGSEEPRKGFCDFFEALQKLEKEHPDFPGWECHLTGSKPDDEDARRILSQSFRSCFHFLGRVENFIEAAGEFDLAIHPSRAESFGMAPLELILAGIPTLVSTTGVIEKLEIPAAWKFPPHNPIALASCLENLWRTWPASPPEVGSIQQQIRDEYHIEKTAASVAEEARRLRS